MTTNRPLRVFLCHSSADKPAVRELYQKLRTEPWIEPWLDEEELFPGMDWNLEIEKAIEATDVILVCLSNNSITKEGYVQREIRIALDYADYKPEGTLFIIPVRLEECTPPKRLARWQYADCFEGQRVKGIERLLVSMKRRAESLGLKNFNQLDTDDFPYEENIKGKEIHNVIIKTGFEEINVGNRSIQFQNKIILSNGMEFMRVPAGGFLMGYDKTSVDISYEYWMARFPVTNELYNTYAMDKGINHLVSGWKKKKDHPVTYMKYTYSMAYCEWLNTLFQTELPAGLVLRLPTEAEWEKAARGTDGREYPWGNTFDKNKCNTVEGGKGGTTSVGFYSPSGDSPYGCADMAGNVWEWTHSLKKEYPNKVNNEREDVKIFGSFLLRGGSFNYYMRSACCAYRNDDGIFDISSFFGFRVVLAPSLHE